MAGVDIVVHLANRAHRTAIDRSAAVEAEAAAALARQAAAAGVRRLVHMSSVRAMGEATPPGVPFRAGDAPRPQDRYGRGKLATERALLAATQGSGLDLVLLRPPLVYGPGVRANFRALIRLAGSGLPLPFAGIDNRRSLIFIDNLVGLTALACIHPAAAGRVLLARDAADLSTPQLLRASGRGSRPAGPAVRRPRRDLQSPAPAAGARAVLRPPDAVAAGRRQCDARGTRVGTGDRTRTGALGDRRRLPPPVVTGTGRSLSIGAFRRPC